ncbi:cytochrome-c oxidase, cbb3-type subunit III [Qipengyuania sp. 1NDW9]|uniref:cytochrome-c oxidase, cbb3-type subunit III n=1 Tax=Qipengyuania xiapuensis TaxID=2867236 RepID=UPI001C87CD3A|nr:cytochrome-c oxidase, cbb3-type subunit III [Qipengyuania xiapuensis]MBX7492739.1 cytochrome-c oxidase, cbb3-type subunit III [Qipengyuania xiapuensis]
MANDEKRIDQPTGTEFVGHEWDGIEELDTPLPRWWLWTFYLTVIWGLGYTIAYPAWPMLSSATEGLLGWTSRGQLAEEMSVADQARVSVGERLAATDVEKLLANPELMQQATAGGGAAFRVHCTQCHGSGAGGNQELGYPNLNDDDWLWGGSLTAIEYSISNGIRQPDADRRQGAMPSFDGAFDSAQMSALVSHVRSLSGLEAANSAGAQLYSENCSVCHGNAGQGDRTVGAPRLDDAIWLRGSSPEAVRAQILNPKLGVMPAFGDRLDPVTIKMLTAYVHTRGGGEDEVIADETSAETVTAESAVDGANEQP